MEHPAVLTDGEDPDEGGVVLDVEGEAHRAGVFEGEGVVVEVDEAYAPDEVFGVCGGV